MFGTGSAASLPTNTRHHLDQRQAARVRSARTDRGWRDLSAISRVHFQGMAVAGMQWTVNPEQPRVDGKTKTARTEKSEDKQDADLRQWFSIDRVAECLQGHGRANSNDQKQSPVFSNSLIMTGKADSSFAYVQAVGQPFSPSLLRRTHGQQDMLMSHVIMACYPISILWTTDGTKWIVSSAFHTFPPRCDHTCSACNASHSRISLGRIVPQRRRPLSSVSC